MLFSSLLCLLVTFVRVSAHDPGDFPCLSHCHPHSNTITLPKAPANAEPYQLSYDKDTCFTSYCQKISASDCAMDAKGSFLCQLGLPLPAPFASPESPCVLLITYLVNQTQFTKPCGVVYEPKVLKNSNADLHAVYIYANADLNVNDMALASVSGNLSLSSSMNCSRIVPFTPLIRFGLCCKCPTNNLFCLNPVRNLAIATTDSLYLNVLGVEVPIGNVGSCKSIGYNVFPADLLTLVLTSLTLSPFDNTVFTTYAPGDNRVYLIQQPPAGLEYILYLDPNTCGDTDGYFAVVNSSTSCANGYCTLSTPLPAPTIAAVNATGCLLMVYYNTLILGARYVPIGRVAAVSRNADSFLALSIGLNVNLMTSISASTNSSNALVRGTDFSVTAVGSFLLNIAFGSTSFVQVYNCSCVVPGCLQRATQDLIPGQTRDFVSSINTFLRPVLSLGLAPWELACDGELTNIQLESYYNVLPGNVIVLRQMPARSGVHIYLNETQCQVKYHEFIRPENCTMQNGFAYCNLTNTLPLVLSANCSVYASVCALSTTVNVTIGVMAQLNWRFDPSQFEFSCSQGHLASAIDQVYLLDTLLLRRIFLNSSFFHCRQANTWCGAHGEILHRYRCFCSDGACGMSKAPGKFIQLMTPACGASPLGQFDGTPSPSPLTNDPFHCVFPSILSQAPTTSSPTPSPTARRLTSSPTTRNPTTPPEPTPVPPTESPTTHPPTEVPSAASKPTCAPSNGHREPTTGDINGAPSLGTQFVVVAIALALIQ